MNDETKFRARRPRHDGWTIERQARFLASLEQTGNVGSAAAAAGMNRASAYRLRDRPEGRPFSRAWDVALLRRRERLLAAHRAKSTVLFSRRRQSDESDTLNRPAAAGQDDKGDSRAHFSPHSQLRQDRRFPRRDSAQLRALIEAACGDSAFPLEGGTSNA